MNSRFISLIVLYSQVYNSRALFVVLTASRVTVLAYFTIYVFHVDILVFISSFVLKQLTIHFATTTTNYVVLSK